MPRILTGIQSTGTPHLGNILGAILPGIKLSNNTRNESLFFIADLHSLTQIKNSEQVRRNTFSVAAAWIALGFDYKNGYLYKQSDIPEVCELTWYLSCFTPYPMLANAHSFKDKSDRLHEVNTGLFVYPVLMASDILLYDADIVPIGKDQKQHLEITRDVALTFNRIYGDTFVVPQASFSENVMAVPGTDGQKMSKSYNNYIDIFEDEKAMKKRVMSIVTDSKGVAEPKDPDQCIVFKLYSLVADKNNTEELRKKYFAGNFGYGSAKNELFGLLLEKFRNERKNFNELMSDTGMIEKILKEGAMKVRNFATAVLQRVRGKLGYG
ncbi:MAG: tryptophan--tRNA ligase [Bacteroidetes bacterium RIFCSPLOWO2_02_FULL_36_8]|nr:MAG: tryptophan--tRNA ligase [Bacteroidetes bacterium RIFCSPLOWO2_02_FULL_36_8]OFY70178.1 MAG: tryptophan--tRNA ligase [Bacteroidetes bacterium RIFCSPLOWO2_12_FULL_37_12]